MTSGDPHTGSAVVLDGATGAGASAATSVRIRRTNRALDAFSRFGVIGLFVAMAISFSVARPEQFPTWENAKAILLQAAIVGVLGAGLTVVLIIGEFDLSFDANAAMSGACAVLVMSHLHEQVAVGVAVGLGMGAGIGAINGLLVAYGRAPAFIATLAVSSVALGAQSWITGDQTTYGVPNSYLSLGTSSFLGIPTFVWISVGVVLVVTAILRFTVFGRHAYAVGSNAVAAESAGIRTREVRFAAFVVLGILAGVAAILLTAQNGGSAPSDATGILLPTYTAAFLGATVRAGGGFSPIATYFGVIFIGTLTTGLTMIQQPRWVANLITGLVLIGAILLRRRR